MMELNRDTANLLSDRRFQGLMSESTNFVTNRYQTWNEWSEAGECIQKEQNHVYAKWQEAKAKQNYGLIALWEVKLQELSWRIEEHTRHEP